MHGAELSAHVVTRERAEAEALAAEHEELLLLLTTLRAASADALCALYFERTLAARAGHRRLKALVEHALVARQAIADNRSAYRLAGAALALSTRIRARVSDAARKQLSEDEAEYGWLRSSVWAWLARRGFHVGRGLDELLALRRFQIDEQQKRAQVGSADAIRVLNALRADPLLTPLFRSRCGRCRWEGPLGASITICPTCQGRAEPCLAQRRYECTKCGRASDRAEPHDGPDRPRRPCAGTMREADHLAFDVAWRTASGRREVLLVFVDDPGRDLAEQLRALPLRIAGQPRLPIILRTTDVASVFNRDTQVWTSTGERHRALQGAFSDAGDSRMYPFATTAEVVDPCPKLQLRLSHNRRRKDKNHA